MTGHHEHRARNGSIHPYHRYIWYGTFYQNVCDLVILRNMAGAEKQSIAVPTSLYTQPTRFKSRRPGARSSVRTTTRESSDSAASKSIKRRRKDIAVSASLKEDRTVDQDLFVTTSSAVRSEKGSSEISNLIPKSPPHQPKADVASQRIGPVQRAASNIRSTIIQAYDPNVCKDWKRYGNCGFGGDSCLLVACLCPDSPCVLTLFLDSCKFLHGRDSAT